MGKENMLKVLRVNEKDKVPKYRQIVNSVIDNIARGYMKTGDQLMSITEMSIEYLLSRDTVEKAYRELKKRGYIEAVHGKGFFVKSNRDSKNRVLLIMNKMSSYKKIIYEAIIKELGDDFVVDLQIHNYSVEALDDILSRNLGKYNHYLIMPHFLETKEEYLPVLHRIPKYELIFLDKYLPEFPESPVIYQDFEKDIFEVFEENLEKIKKYEKLCLIFPQDGNYPEEIRNGFSAFCAYNSIKQQTFSSSLEALESYTENSMFVVIEEADLADVIKFARNNLLSLGKKIGVISFNDTKLKEVLEITVITTDFNAMGTRAAQILKNKEQVIEKNPFYLIDRGSA